MIAITAGSGAAEFVRSLSGLAKSLRGSFTWIVIGSGVYAACQWGLLTVLAKLGDAEMIGQYALGLAISAPVLTLAQMNLRSVLVADQDSRNVFRDYLSLRILTTIAGMLTVLGIAAVSAYSTTTRAVIITVGIGQSIEGISDIYYGRLQKQENMRPIALSMIVRGLLSVLALAALVRFTHSVLWGTTAIVIVRFGVLLVWDHRQALPERPGPSGLRNRIRLQSRLAATALPLGVVLMLGAFMVNSPRYAIEKHLGLAELGLFAAISSLVSVGSTLMSALGNCVMPRLVRLRLDGSRREFTSLAVALALCAGLAGLIGTVVATAAGGPLLAILFRRSYAGSQPLLVAMMIAGTISYLAQGAGYVATAVGAFWAQVPFVACAAAISSILSFALISPRGLMGGVIAIGVASAVQFLGTAIVAYLAVRKSYEYHDSGVCHAPFAPLAGDCPRR